MVASAVRELLARLGPLPTVRLGAAADAVEPLARVGFRLHALDALLGGGLPRGRLCEITGPSSCGKTALLHALLATATTHGEVVALVDLPDAFSPPAAAATGIDLARMLWVRPASLRHALRCAEVLVETSGFGTVALDLGTGVRGIRLGNGAWPRLARAAERSTATVVVLAGDRVTGSTAALGLALRPVTRHWSSRGCGPVLFDGLDTEIALVRTRLGAPQRTVAVRVAAA